MTDFKMSNQCNSQTIYIVTLASEEEIKRGEYIELFGMKISSNKAKHGIIKNIKIEEEGEANASEASPKTHS